MTTKFRCSGSRGQSLVELALVLPLLLLLVAGGADLARAYIIGLELQDGARAAVLYATQNQNYSSSNYSGLDTAVQNAASGSLIQCTNSLFISPSSSSPLPTTPGPSGSVWSYQTVVVSCKMTLLTPILPFSSITIQAHAVGLVKSPT